MSQALSLAYREPLHIVSGRGAYLYDAGGREFLDLVNNVAHVGHCHPRVVEAGARQMAELNTNTRYLHGSVVDYARRLASTFPDPLHVCFFVNSGSEANDLALRLAAAHTGREDVIVLDHAYHGHLRSTIALSPYKFRDAKPPRTHIAALPTEPDALDSLRAAIDAPAAFFAESLQGCGGQIVYPEGYLTAAFEAVRAAGGVCVADEVQVGFGRIGEHFWGFELDGVVPDIVTLGKPIGNGHPLGAVVTTPEIAASFVTGMEYFNTFGGNPVSAEIGLAVLDVIADERLQAHALAMGERLLSGLRDARLRRRARARAVPRRGVPLARARASDQGAAGRARRADLDRRAERRRAEDQAAARDLGGGLRPLPGGPVRRALVTGPRRARLLAARGTEVVISSTTERIHERAAELGARGVVADLTSWEDAQRLVAGGGTGTLPSKRATRDGARPASRLRTACSPSERVGLAARIDINLHTTFRPAGWSRRGSARSGATIVSVLGHRPVRRARPAAYWCREGGRRGLTRARARTGPAGQQRRAGCTAPRLLDRASELPSARTRHARCPSPETRMLAASPDA